MPSCLFLYVCLYVNMYACMHVGPALDVYVSVSKRPGSWPHRYQTCICFNFYLSSHVCVDLCIYAFMDVCTYAITRITLCMHVCMLALIVISAYFSSQLQCLIHFRVCSLSVATCDHPIRLVWVIAFMNNGISNHFMCALYVYIVCLVCMVCIVCIYCMFRQRMDPATAFTDLKNILRSRV